MAVRQPATKPPVQDSAVASLRRRFRQSTNRAAACFSRSSGNTLDYSPGHQRPPYQPTAKTGQGAGQEIVEDDAEAAGHVAIRPGDRPGFGNVEKAEQGKAQKIGQRVDGQGDKCQPLAGDFVDNYCRRVLDATAPDIDIRGPDSEGCNGDDSGEQTITAKGCRDEPGGRQSRQRSPRARRRA